MSSLYYLDVVDADDDVIAVHDPDALDLSTSTADPPDRGDGDDGRRGDTSDTNGLCAERTCESLGGAVEVSGPSAVTRGGDAELELINNNDPFSEGVMFSVRPPHKSWKQMSKLSGGEKTLSSLSLIFALHYYKPTPIYFMDEIDAALDFRNVEIVAKFIKERTKDAQFIVISLRNHMYELANQLVGIYKLNDTTKSIKTRPEGIMRDVEREIERVERNKEKGKGGGKESSAKSSRVMSVLSQSSVLDGGERRRTHMEGVKKRLSRKSMVFEEGESKRIQSDSE